MSARRSALPVALMLAVSATGTAVCLSVIAGWQRGGSLPERLVWVAIGVVLVLSAHLLPALVRVAPLYVRIVAAALWSASMATACYGHATFFLLAQQHAGMRRAAAVTVEVRPDSRSLTAVMTERTSVIRQLSLAQSSRCMRDCTVLNSRHVTLAAHLDALNAEAEEIRRDQAADDRLSAQRDALLADPVTTRLAGLLGTTTSRVDLLSGIAFAAVLEGIACLLWTAALDRRLPETDKRAVTATVLPSLDSVSDGHALSTRPDPSLTAEQPVDDDLDQLQRDVAAGNVRVTVSDIRRHLGCSQARATALRRQMSRINVSR